MFVGRSIGLCVFFTVLSSLVAQSQNVGVGTTSPNARLHVVGPTNSTVPILKVEGDASTSPFLIVTQTGNTGINVSNPAEALDVAGSIQFSGALMPAGNAGASGQVLVSQGPGSPPLWQSMGGTGGVAGLCSSPTANYIQKWTGSELCNSIIYDNGSNVGIGTNNPTRLFTVMDVAGTAPGAIYARQMITDPSAWTLGAYLTGRGIASSNNSSIVTGVFAYASWDPVNGVTVNSNATGLHALGTNEGAGILDRAYGVRSYVHLPNNSTGRINLGYAIYARCKDAQTCYGIYVRGDANNSQDWGMYIHADANRNYIGGDLGIGANPTAKLDVAGDIKFSGALMPNGNPGNIGEVLVSQGSGSPPQWQSIGGAGGVAGLCSSPTANYIQKWTGTELCNSQIFDDGTNVGIGTASPTEKLDVVGNLKFSGAIMPGGNAGTSGYVLTSQGPGVAPTWTDPATFGDNWGSQVAQTQNPIIGDGTSGNPITFASGTSAGQVWKWDGSQWVLAKDSVGDNWGGQVAVTGGPVVGNGTSGSPITFASGSASGDIWQWNGSSWQLVQLRSAVASSGFDSVCSSATNNYVQKWTGTELCNSIIYDDGNKVGIRTNSPIAPFQIGNQIFFNEGIGNASSGPDIRFSKRGLISADASLFVNFNGLGDTSFTYRLTFGHGTHNDSARPVMTINTKNNVGVRTTSPIAPLQVSTWIYMGEGLGDASLGPDIRFGKRGNISSDLSMFLLFNGSNDQTDTHRLSIGFGDYKDTSAYHVLTITTDTNVGIREFAPIAPLQIEKWIYMGEGKGDISIGPDIRFSKSGLISADNTMIINFDGNNNATNNYLHIGYGTHNNSSTYVLTISDQNKVGIGVTNPTNILTIQQNSPSDPIADSWLVYSTPETKEQIIGIVDNKAAEYLQQFRNLPVYAWRRSSRTNDPVRLSVMAQKETPQEILAYDENGNIQGIDLYGYIGYLHVVMKGMLEIVEMQQTEIQQLKKQLRTSAVNKSLSDANQE